MSEQITRTLAMIKKEFVKKHDVRGKTIEIIPVPGSAFPIPKHNLDRLHSFLAANKIYDSTTHDELVGSERCMVYKGDINRYWLSSISHDSCHAQFSPTWITSAYVIAMLAKELGYQEAIDIGAGDGRIAFCARLLGMKSHAIEIDPMLVNIQKSNCTANFMSHCSDATKFDYSILNLKRPIFFIGGLAQMGGDVLASGVIKRVRRIPGLWRNSGWVFAGTHAPKYAPDPKGCAGWGTMLQENNLEPARTVILPTAWTLGEPQDTPYVFARPQS